MDTSYPDPTDEGTALRVKEYNSRDERYGQMNRKQRRHAKAHEQRELRKQRKNRD